jgi:pimeloyl-ACP methyl ester carboxylesterase
MRAGAAASLQAIWLNEPKFWVASTKVVSGVHRRKWRRSRRPLKLSEQRKSSQVDARPPYYSEQLARAIPGARLNLYEDGGDFFYLVHADRFNAEIRDFMTLHE